MAPLTSQGAAPNFFIAGAPNTGTTSLYHYLRQHPQVFMCPVKEPSYFGSLEFVGEPRIRDAAWQDVRRSVSWKLRRFIKRSRDITNWDEYCELFRGVRDERAIGEATPRYLVLPGAAGAIARRIPHAKLIFVLRDPADWILTRYLARFWPDRRSSFRERFLSAMRRGDEWASAVRVGHYATHLQPFFDAFPREQIQIHLYEDLVTEARQVVRKMLTFLEVDPEYPIDTSRRYRESKLPRFPRLHAVRARVLQDLPIARWLPAGTRAWLRRLYHRPRPAITLDPADRQLVVDYYRDEIRRAAELVGRDLSAWIR